MKNFLEVFTHTVALPSILYSTLLSLAAVGICLILGISLANRITRGNFTSFWESIALFPLTIPGIVIAYGYVLGFSGTFLDPRKNPTWILIIAYSVRRIPVMVKILVSGMKTLNKELEEAAQTLGANHRLILLRITVPLLLPYLIASSILVFTSSLLEVSDSLLLAFEEKYYPIAKSLYVLQGRPDGPPVACALAVLIMLFTSGALLIAARLSGKKIGELFQT